MKGIITTEKILLMLREALDFNTSIVAYTGLLINNKDSSKDIKKVHAHLTKLNKDYEQRLKDIVGME